MGHESCGAVRAALTVSRNGNSFESVHLEHMLNQINRNLLIFSSGDRSYCEKTLKEPVVEHAKGTMKEILKESRIIRVAVSSGKLKIVTAYDDITSGRVEILKK